ncbi:MAG: LacI family DNA-binding transcriptional regulator [Clostridia bacterium]|nr:LacI family DNA-binding transcriptional regulator [Clostridia bacterium]
MNMSKLARLVGVSVATVSKAFSGSKEISDITREKIFSVAREEGCYDKYCKALYTAPVIAIICPEFKSRYYSEQLSLLESEIRNHGGTAIVACTDFDKDRQEELLTFFTEYSKVDGIIMYSPVTDKKYSVPIVSIGEHDVYSCVTLSNKKATYEAIQHFKEYGHRDIAFISEPHTSGSLERFAEIMKECNLPIKEEYMTSSKHRFELAGYEAMERLLSLPKPPTAVIAAYDDIAIGAMKCIRDRGKKVPDDISLIGYNDIKETPYLDVPLTTVTSYNEDFCQVVVDLVFEQISSPAGNIHKKINISTELVKRGSVGPVKGE